MNNHLMAAGQFSLIDAVGGNTIMPIGIDKKNLSANDFGFRNRALRVLRFLHCLQVLTTLTP